MILSLPKLCNNGRLILTVTCITWKKNLTKMSRTVLHKCNIIFFVYLCKCLVNMYTRCKKPQFLLQILLRETVIEKLQYVES